MPINTVQKQKYNLTNKQITFGNAKALFHKPFLRQDALPLLPVPQKLWFTWTGSKVTFKVEPSVSPGVLAYQRNPIPVPLVDTLGTAFIKEELPIQYTIQNILFLSERTGYKSSSSKSSSFSISYALDILKDLGKESAGEVTGEYSKQFETTMSFFIENTKAFWELESKSVRNNENYKQLISGVIYDDNDPGVPSAGSDPLGLQRERPVK